MVLISGVLKGPYGDTRTGVTITMRSLKTSSTVLNLAKSQSVTDDSGQYSLNVEPGAYEVIISVYGAQPERVGTIEVYTDSLAGTLNDFLRRPGESDITPEIVQTVDRMRVEAAVSADKSAASAASAKVSEQSSANILKGAAQKDVANIFTAKQSIKTTASGQAADFESSGTVPLRIARSNASASAANLSLQFELVDKDNTSIIKRYLGIRQDGVPYFSDLDDLSYGNPIFLDNKAGQRNTIARALTGKSGLAFTNSGDADTPKFMRDSTFSFFTHNWWPTIDADSPYAFQMCYRNSIVGFRTVERGGAVGKGWCELWHTGNTTVDANGFIKKASPIARLSGAPEKMADDYLAGFTLAGSVAVNSEAEGVTAERVSVGVYKVIGSLGFAEEGWNIEVPQDVNGNRLCFVETSTNRDGTIYVKVSKRRFDIDTAAIVAGDPMDIPDGRWIDLRLEMPVLEKVEDPPVGEA
jgi:hypothetical protein